MLLIKVKHQKERSARAVHYQKSMNNKARYNKWPGYYSVTLRVGIGYNSQVYGELHLLISCSKCIHSCFIMKGAGRRGYEIFLHNIFILHLLYTVCMVGYINRRRQASFGASHRLLRARNKSHGQWKELILLLSFREYP